jgi:hypothetical protein
VTAGVLTTGVLTAGTVTDGIVTEGTVTDGTVTAGVVTDGTLKVGIETFGSTLAPLDSDAAHRTPSRSKLKRVPVVAIRRAMSPGTSRWDKTCANPHRTCRRTPPDLAPAHKTASPWRLALLAYLHFELV